MTPLHYLGETLRTLLGIIPLPVVRAIFVAVPLLLIIWVLRLPREATTPKDGTGRWDENLKLWACAALLVQVVLYIVL